MPISVGDRLPDAAMRIMTADGPKDVTTSEIFDGKLVAAFAVPGAFTPTCHAKHLPGFLEKLDAFKAKGVDTVACIAVNDVFVLNAWAKQSGAEGRILFLADGNGDFTRAIGLEWDRRGAIMGMRSQRYAMLVEDRVVKTLNVEDGPGKAEISSAEELLRALQPAADMA